VDRKLKFRKKEKFKKSLKMSRFDVILSRVFQSMQFKRKRQQLEEEEDEDYVDSGEEHIEASQENEKEVSTKTRNKIKEENLSKKPKISCKKENISCEGQCPPVIQLSESSGFDLLDTVPDEVILKILSYLAPIPSLIITKYQFSIVC
jgi:hypothetical protein